MENCTECNTSYDPETVNIPSPISNGMCAVCGTQLTDAKIEELKALIAAK